MVRNRRRLDVSSKQQRPRHGGAYCADLVLHARVLSVLSMLAVGLPSCGVSTGGGNNYPKVVRVPVLPRTSHLSFQYPRDSRGLSHFSFSYPGDSRGLSHFSFWYPRDSRGLSHSASGTLGTREDSAISAFGTCLLYTSDAADE